MWQALARCSGKGNGCMEGKKARGRAEWRQEKHERGRGRGMVRGRKQGGKRLRSHSPRGVHNCRTEPGIDLGNRGKHTMSGEERQKGEVLVRRGLLCACGGGACGVLPQNRSRGDVQ